MKKIITILVLNLISLNIFSQDISINILQIPGDMLTNSSGKIQIDICNNNPTDVLLPANKIRPLISIPPLITFDTPLFTDLPAGWFVCSNDGTNLRLSNGTDATLPQFECRTFFINVKSGTTTGGPTTISSTLAFANGTNGCTAGPQTVGNVTGNDNSETTVKVTAPLPLNLLSFDAKRFQEQVNLNWKTANEENFSHFEIQKSINSKEFGTFAKVDGNSSRFYSTTDSNPNLGNNYYRLKMVDLDGSFKFSKIINVIFKENEGYLNVENPAINGELKVFTNLGNSNINLYNSLGAKTAFKLSEMQKDNYQLKIESPVSGLYYLIINNSKTIFVKKVLIP